jgi:hypothetical protein
MLHVKPRLPQILITADELYNKSEVYFDIGSHYSNLYPNNIKWSLCLRTMPLRRMWGVEVKHYTFSSSALHEAVESASPSGRCSPGDRAPGDD